MGLKCVSFIFLFWYIQATVLAVPRPRTRIARMPHVDVTNTEEDELAARYTSKETSVRLQVDAEDVFKKHESRLGNARASKLQNDHRDLTNEEKYRIKGEAAFEAYLHMAGRLENSGYMISQGGRDITQAYRQAKANNATADELKRIKNDSINQAATNLQTHDASGGNYFAIRVVADPYAPNTAAERQDQHRNYNELVTNLITEAAQKAKDVKEARKDVHNLTKSTKLQLQNQFGDVAAKRFEEIAKLEHEFYDRDSETVQLGKLIELEMDVSRSVAKIKMDFDAKLRKAAKANNLDDKNQMLYEKAATKFYNQNMRCIGDQLGEELAKTFTAEIYDIQVEADEEKKKKLMTDFANNLKLSTHIPYFHEALAHAMENILPRSKQDDMIEKVNLIYKLCGDARVAVPKEREEVIAAIKNKHGAAPPPPPPPAPAPPAEKKAEPEPKKAAPVEKPEEKPAEKKKLWSNLAIVLAVVLVVGVVMAVIAAIIAAYRARTFKNSFRVTVPGKVD